MPKPPKLHPVEEPIPGKCNAPLNKGGRCKLSAGWNTDHNGSGPCSRHGGCLPTVSMHHSTKLVMEAIKIPGGGMLEIDPIQALLEEVWRTAGRVAWLRQKISELDGNPQLMERTIAGMNPVGLVKWEQQERQMLVLATKACISAGIAERQVKLAEMQGQLVADAFRRLLDDPELGLTDAQKANAPEIVRRVLTAVAA